MFLMILWVPVPFLYAALKSGAFLLDGEESVDRAEAAVLCHRYFASATVMLADNLMHPGGEPF